MPVKITTNRTNASSGEISVGDLKSMKTEFIHKADITAANGRSEPIIKNYSFYFLKEELIELLNMYSDEAGVKVQIGVNTASTEDVCGNPQINQICAIIETYVDITTRTDDRPEGKFVLVNGYQSFGKIKILSTNDPVCCPSSDPGNGIII